MFGSISMSLGVCFVVIKRAKKEIKILHRRLEDLQLLFNKSKQTHRATCVCCGGATSNWIRKCNQGGLIMDGGLFISASSSQTCAYILAASCTGKGEGKAVNSQPGEWKGDERGWRWQNVLERHKRLIPPRETESSINAVLHLTLLNASSSHVVSSSFMCSNLPLWVEGDKKKGKTEGQRCGPWAFQLYSIPP